MKYNREELTGNYTRDDFVFFWSHNEPANGGVTKACLSQWYPCQFEEPTTGVKFCCAEQHMMYYKACCFNDIDTANQIINTKDPKTIKALGRRVKNFNESRWNEVKGQIVCRGNYLKFTQNPKLKEYLLSTGNKILVEASPQDCIWGIGMRETARDATCPSKWLGQNLLGFLIMIVRDYCKE